jgi:BlaI family transcriptional regulator, penicillinase repressor
MESCRAERAAGTRRGERVVSFPPLALRRLPRRCPEPRGNAVGDNKPKDLSAAEWKVMKIAWELKKAMAREIYVIAGERHGWTSGTVKTLLKRLCDKGYLKTTKVGNGFVYRPARSAISVLRAAADTLLGNAVPEASGPLLAHMVEKSSLSGEDLDALQKLIDAKKEAAGGKQ